MSASADVLIVGAGSAGSVLAERLSADPSRRVVLLEAGPDRTAAGGGSLDLPIGTDSPVARRYRTALTADHQTDLVRGCCVGGSGAINGGYFCPALPGDIDPLPGWSAEEVDAHFRAVAARVDARPVAAFSPPTAAFIAAAQGTGFRWPVDLAAGADGVCAVPLNISAGARRDPAAVFLKPALDRPNLLLHSGVRVNRIRIDGRRATGVDAVGPDGPLRLDADEVVLAAGAVESAHLLMLSGIGPGGAVADLPVGLGFADHPEWVMGTGWPAAAAGNPVLEAVLIVGDLEIRPYTTGFGAAHTTIAVALMRPRSRGVLTLVSADPAVPPRIEHRYDSEPEDIAELQRGADLVAEILSGATELGGPIWSTSQHLCGTAPMGTVVDEQCRVIGVTGLRVIDGSVLARIPRRGPHATIAMLAHRAAEFVSGADSGSAGA